VGRAPSPDHAEMPNVVARDLIERGVAHVGVRTTVGGPLAERRLKGGGTRTRGPATRKDEETDESENQAVEPKPQRRHRAQRQTRRWGKDRDCRPTGQSSYSITHVRS